MDEARLVEIAVSQGLVTTSQVQAAEHERLSRADRGVVISTWELLQDLGHLSETAARKLRKISSSSGLSALEVAGYVLQGRLGAGGMGDVFRGRNAKGAEVAVKLLNQKYHTNTEYIRRFEREARASMRLNHPHICRSLGHGEAHNTRYLLMEIIEGPSLKARIQDHGPISERDAVILLEQIAAALGTAWTNGILHRDVKPANIILGPPRAGIDEPFCAKLIDFGLAKILHEPDHDRAEDDTAGGLTGAGLALGTPHYMSPEQASGQPDLDQRCDIYGLGASLYHALMGHTMYSGKSSAVIMYKQVTEQIDLTELRKKGARKQLVELLERMLAKDRNKRLPTWEAVLLAGAKVKALLGAGLGTAPGAQASAPAPAPRISAAISAAVAAHGAPPPAVPHPVPHAPAPAPGPGARAKSPRAVVATLILGLALAGGATAWLMQNPGGPRRVTPATIADHLIPSPHGLHAEDSGECLMLAPGAYPALRLGAAQAGLILRAESTGTSLAGITADPGLTLELIGIDLSAPLSVSAGAHVIVTGGHLAGATVSGGKLELTSTHIMSRVMVNRQGTLIAHGGRLDHGLELEDSTLDLNDLALDEGLTVVRGTVRVRGSTLSAGQASAAIVLDRAPHVELENTTIRGGATAISAIGSRLVTCKKVELTGTELGISWLGPVEPTWQWADLAIHAPLATTGLPAGFAMNPSAP